VIDTGTALDGDIDVAGRLDGADGPAGVDGWGVLDEGAGGLVGCGGEVSGDDAGGVGTGAVDDRGGGGGWEVEETWRGVTFGCRSSLTLVGCAVPSGEITPACGPRGFA
jgi:hypothetical protein